MNNVIKDIQDNKNIDQIYHYAIKNLFCDGPISITVLEILTYICIFNPNYFATKKEEVLEIMGVFYKSLQPTTLESALFKTYSNYIEEKYLHSYTPVQANIIDKINNYKYFSFSAPTSTGKSHIFRDIIKQSKRDMVIIVPSRALINEYYDRTCELIKDKTVNILTFIDRINIKHAVRSIFILTPERAKELFKFKKEFDIELFLFDEAQLSNEDSVRALYFDSIVRRIQNAYPDAKFVFAHPFVINPDAQLLKNKFDLNESNALQYRQKNVGQIFFCHDNEVYYHFGTDKNIMGSQKVQSNYDPLMQTISNGGSILVYTTKASIYDKKVFTSFQKYIRACTQLTDKKALRYIEQLKAYIGADDKDDGYYYSQMIDLLKKGIVIHHGSLPLQARLLLEHFTQEGYCRLCFATSTLEQGINMPFDVVYLNTFPKSKPLSIKNLIGRAGRSTSSLKFDYGSVVIHQNNMSAFRNVMQSDESLSYISQLDTADPSKDESYQEFKEAINSGTFSDEFNLTYEEVERLREDNVDPIVDAILNTMFVENSLISLREINQDQECKLLLYNNFAKLYSFYLKGRVLSEGEKSVLNTAIKILIWRVHGKTFKNICWYRYAYTARVPERQKLNKQYKTASPYEKKRIRRKLESLYANFFSQYADLPDATLSNFSLFGNHKTKARDVDYDRVVFDTYDYLDKLIGFKLNDIFYAIFYQYYEKTKDNRALTLFKYIKYGTDDEREIWMLRYGLSFEDIEWAKEYITGISEDEIIFSSAVDDLPIDKRGIIDRFIL